MFFRKFIVVIKISCFQIWLWLSNIFCKYIDYFNNGKPQLIIDYVDNKKHGNYKELDIVGNKVSIGEYRKDIPHGKWVWWKNKVKVREISYNNGLKNGPIQVFNNLGKIKIRKLFFIKLKKVNATIAKVHVLIITMEVILN